MLTSTSANNLNLCQQPQPLPTTSTSANNLNLCLVERVLKLRQRLNIDTYLSNHGPEVTVISAQTSKSSVPTSITAHEINESRAWLAWSQSPNDGNPPGQD